MSQLKPFLKWAGGKTQLLNNISERFPFNKDDEFIYIEPFVGSGAVLFWILSHYPNIKYAVINDINSDLIITYKTIQKSVKSLINILKKWEHEYHLLEDDKPKKSDYYYLKREQFNKRDSKPILQSAIFIFLNRTCYNGLYRVNSSNGFNVPIGSYKKPLICDENNLNLVSNILKKVKIKNSDFEETLEHAQKPCFFYFDPPYKPLNLTSNFNSYAKKEFDDKEQIRLKNFCDRLSKNCFKWMLSNSDVNTKSIKNDFFDNLYKNYNIERVLARRNINSKSSKRGKIFELLITN